MYAVVRIRGTINAKGEIRDTLKMLRLYHINNCTIIPETKSFKGMLQKVKDYVTWGEIDKETIEMILEKEGIDASNAEKVLEGQVKDVLHLPIRLHPPIKGYKSIKKPYSMGGSLGYRGKEINELIRRML